MTIRVRLFAQMAQQAGDSTFNLDVPTGAMLASIWPLLEKKYPALRWPQGALFAVNQEYAAPDRLLLHGDEVAIIPPVSGG